VKETPIPVLKDTWGRAFTVWWSFTWRMAISLFFGALLIFLAIKFAPAYFHIKKALVIKISYVFGALYVFFFSVLFIKGMLNRRFKGFSVVIIKTQ
jgi:hypothetical protein